MITDEPYLPVEPEDVLVDTLEPWWTRSTKPEEADRLSREAIERAAERR